MHLSRMLLMQPRTAIQSFWRGVYIPAHFSIGEKESVFDQTILGRGQLRKIFLKRFWMAAIQMIQ